MRPIFGYKHKLLLFTSILLTVGFLVTTLASYFVSKMAIRNTIIENELPITADNVYSEIQKDLVQPILVSSMMASDTFLRDWVLGGERDTAKITKYLKEVKDRYKAVTSFFVSERSRIYYYAGGVLKRVREDQQRDVWYFRVRKMSEPYEINVDPDLANRDAMTIFINYRVLDYNARFIGVTGVGLTVEAVKKMVNEYQRRYGRSIFFVDQGGKIVLRADERSREEADIRKIEGLSGLADTIFKTRESSFIYKRGGNSHLLNVRFIPELNWYLFVEKTENEAISGIRRVLFINLAVFLVTTTIILIATTMIINRFQARLEEMATTDGLTGLYNRQAFDILMGQFLLRQKRTAEPFSVILFDIDFFKLVNDDHGHLAGDRMLTAVAQVAKSRLRAADILCRWGGEEFLAVLQDCSLANALRLAEDIRESVGATAVQYEAREIRVTVSLGVAEFMPGEQIDQLLNRVDQALYRAKGSGRNRISSA